MKKRSVIALFLMLCMVFSLCACGTVAVKENPNTPVSASTPAPNAPADANPEVVHDPITLRLVYANKNEKDANIVRDLLTKKGFNVEMNAQADNSGVKTQAEAGNYDIIVHASGNSAYSVDFALKYFIYPGGALNWSNINDDVLTKMIDEAGASTKDRWDEVYSEIEAYMVDEMVYSTPLYQESQGVASSAALDVETYKPNIALGYLDYFDASLRESRTVKFSFNTSASQFPTLDPIRYTAGVTNYVAPWCYAYLLRYDALEGAYITRGSLSQSYSVSETSEAFYFLLRDDCFFSRVDENGNAYVTDRLVAGEDVVYSILRAADKNSVAGNAAYTYFDSIADCSVVTDLDELKNTKSSAGGSVYDELNAAAANEVTALAEKRDDVDGENGCYQVVRIDTKYPFAQLLNYLNVSYSGILDSEWVESINADVAVEGYNADTDWLYGDTKKFYPDANFHNDCSFSGQYVVLSSDDYGVKLVKNAGFAVNGDPEYDQALITNAEMVYTADATAAFTALRSGDVDFVPKLGNADITVAKGDSNVHLKMIDGSGTHFMIYNRNEDSVCSNLLVRKAISAAINQADVLAGIGNALPANSVICVGFKTTHTFDYDDTATQKYLDEYWASVG